MYLPNIGASFACLLLEELYRNGCRAFFLSPGSRSTHLALQVRSLTMREKDVRAITCYDERSAAFAALGHARATRSPAVVITTSGTAVANLHPAVAEADEDHVPLILLTADRPPELRHACANQTTDQVKLFGHAVRFFSDLPCADDRVSPCAWLSTVDLAVHASMHPNPGPVHLNCMFRVPLDMSKQAYNTSIFDGLSNWSQSGRPWTEYRSCMQEPAQQDVSSVVKLLKRAERGVVVLGQLSFPENAELVRKLCAILGWPVYADVSSGCSGWNDVPLIHNFSYLLRHEASANTFAPDVILHIGRRTVAKPLEKFFEQCAKRVTSCCHIQIDEGERRSDPFHSVSLRLSGSIRGWVSALHEQLALEGGAGTHAFVKALLKVDERIQTALEQHIETQPAVSEPFVSETIGKFLREGNGLFLSSSMPVRDMHHFGLAHLKRVMLGLNRGLSGIDGVLSSAVGFCLGLSRPTTLLIGDLAFLHDTNGLNVLHSAAAPLTVVVLNNGGGAIFGFLPLAKTPELLTPFFDTPHTISLAKLCEAHGIRHVAVESKHAFIDAYMAGIESGLPNVIEVKTDMKANIDLHNVLEAAALSML
jgi:2-succinyl-5-enolpyruvyl-6-hydroxy-3-cyclohexene-1-carboxylate synthase